MRINVEKLDKKLDVIFNKDTSKWHSWFAWYPVKIEHDLVWLEKIERKIKYWACYTSGGWKSYYRYKNKEVINE